MLRKLFPSPGVVLLLFTAAIVFSGCAKEYSYEGSPFSYTPPDSLVIVDTAIQRGPIVPYCISCQTSNPTGLFWSFKFETSQLCGNITNAVITPGRDGFTFFGPSECSIDTGLIMTVLLDSATALNRDRANITTDRASLEYYDNTTLTDVFISKRPSISFTIDSYENATGTAKGTFHGTVTTKDSSKRTLTAGKFVIRFK